MVREPRKPKKNYDQSVGVIYLGDVDVEWQNAVVKFLFARPELKEVWLFVNSDGGEAQAGLAVMSFLKTSKLKVKTFCYGTAYSMGFGLFNLGEERWALEDSHFMDHQLSNSFSPNHSRTTEEQEKTVAENQRVNERYESYVCFAPGSKLSPTKLRNFIKGSRDWFCSTKEAVKLGVVTHVGIPNVAHVSPDNILHALDSKDDCEDED